MDALTPDLAEKVLTAEVRNLIKKVSDGGTLSSAARTMFHKAALLPGLANQARVTSLFKKWASGGRLAADELAELHAWSQAPAPLPLDAPPPEAPAPTPAPSSSQDFTLAAEGPRVVGSRVKYPEQLSVYAALYDASERTIKRMIERGRFADAEHTRQREPLDLPPLHLPAEMPAWYDRRMENRCPPGILKAAEKARRVAATASAKPGADIAKPISVSSPAEASMNVAPDPASPELPLAAGNANSDVAGPPPQQRDFSSIQTLDFTGHVEQLRRSLAIISHQLEEARKGTLIEGKLVIDDGVISSRQRDYRDTSAELRKAENDLLAWQKERGLLEPRDEIRSENNRIASTIFNAVLRLVKKVRPQLHGKTESEQDRLWTSEVLACFAGLKGAKFTTFVPSDDCAG